MAKEKDKSLESWIWDAACSIRGAKDAAKYKDYILPLIFTKRLCDVFDDEVDRIAKEVGSRTKAFQLTKAEAVSQKIKTAFGNFPNWQKSEASLRELRQKVTFAIAAGVGDLDKVVNIADELFTVLEKANRG